MGLRLNRQVDIKSETNSSAFFISRKIYSHGANDAKSHRLVQRWHTTGRCLLATPVIWLTVSWRHQSGSKGYSPQLTEEGINWAFSPKITFSCGRFRCHCIEITAKQAQKTHYKPSSFFLMSLHLWNKRNVLVSMRCNKGQPEGALKRRNDCLATYTTNTTVGGQQDALMVGCKFFDFALFVFFIFFWGGS